MPGTYCGCVLYILRNQTRDMSARQQSRTRLHLPKAQTWLLISVNSIAVELLCWGSSITSYFPHPTATRTNFGLLDKSPNFLLAPSLNTRKEESRLATRLSSVANLSFYAGREVGPTENATWAVSTTISPLAGYLRSAHLYLSSTLLSTCWVVSQPKGLGTRL